MDPADASGLELEIAPVPGAVYTTRYLPLGVLFVNRGTTPVRILDCFHPLPVFFSFEMLDAEKTPFNLPGGGKIDFGPSQPTETELGPGSRRRIEIDLAGLVTEPLRPGPYSIAATYHNQYGERCFRGTLRSNTITIEVQQSRRGRGDGSPENVG